MTPASGLELVAFSSGAIVVGEVSTLAHESRDDPMEDAAFEVEGFARRLSLALLAGAEAPKILGRLGAHALEQLEFHSLGLLLPDRHVQEHVRVVDLPTGLLQAD